jgi:thymidylate synthase
MLYYTESVLTNKMTQNRDANQEIQTRFSYNADEAYRNVIQDLLSDGIDVAALDSKSIGSQQKSKEIMNYILRVQTPAERLPWSYQFNLSGAVARFVWMMGANNRLKDIEFYWGKGVSRFSDDGILVPGSSYGARILHPSPGINQLDSIIERLKADNTTRRAAIAIYQAEDAVRESKDIPCAFGLAFHIREAHLHTSLIMRSNNAYFLLPYNLFEFSLLAEVVAAELKVPLGNLTYHALSMHIYEKDFDNAVKVSKENQSIAKAEMTKMPFEPSPISQVRELVILEAEARQAAAGFNKSNFQEWISQGETRLSPYWRQYYFLLLLSMAKRLKLQFALQLLKSMISSPWKDFLPEDSFEEATQQLETTTNDLDLFGQPQLELRISGSSSDLYNRRLSSLDAHVAKKSGQRRHDGKEPISIEQYYKLRSLLVGDPSEPILVAADGISREIDTQTFENAYNSVFGI